jgi:hypothetical protein
LAKQHLGLVFKLSPMEKAVRFARAQPPIC